MAQVPTACLFLGFSSPCNALDSQRAAVHDLHPSPGAPSSHRPRQPSIDHRHVSGRESASVALMSKLGGWVPNTHQWDSKSQALLSCVSRHRSRGALFSRDMPITVRACSDSPAISAIVQQSVRLLVSREPELRMPPSSHDLLLACCSSVDG